MSNTIKMTIKGKVQGVFFRDNTSKKAVELGLRGYVKNLSNGDVEIVAEGDEDKIKELKQFCHSEPGSSEIKKIIEIDIPNKGYKDFIVRF